MVNIDFESANKTNDSEDILGDFENIINGLSNIRIQINALQQQLRNTEKKIKKKMKCLKREATKNKNRGNRKPSGFAKPTKVTKELCEFMNKKEGSEIARTEVTSTLSSYIKKNNLQNKNNKKIILPDDKLKDLLKINDSEELTYFNIQKYMNKHFISNTTCE